MKRIIIILFLLLIPIVFAFPKYLDTQGVVRNNTNGSVIPNGNYNLNMSYYNSADNSLIYSENQTKEVRDGIFDYLIGYANPFTTNIFKTYDLYLKIMIGDDLTGKINLTASPYAWYCLDSNDSVNFNGQSAGYYLKGNSTADLNNSFLDLGDNNSLVDYINAHDNNLTTNLTQYTNDWIDYVLALYNNLFNNNDTVTYYIDAHDNNLTTNLTTSMNDKLYNLTFNLTEYSKYYFFNLTQYVLTINTSLSNNNVSISDYVANHDNNLTTNLTTAMEYKVANATRNVTTYIDDKKYIQNNSDVTLNNASLGVNSSVGHWHLDEINTTHLKIWRG